MRTFAPAGEEERRATRARLGIATDAFMVLYTGRLGREKGVDVLLRAFGRLVKMTTQARPWLVVAGGPSLGADPKDSERYQEELRELADGLPVSWLGIRSEVVDVIQAADVAVVPSLWPEPLARSLIEPLACGVPVVATTVGGNPEVLIDGLASFLVPPADVDQLADTLASLAHWRVDDPLLGVRCRQAVEGRLSLEREADDIEGVLAGATRR